MIENWTSYRVADFVPFTAEVYLRLLERVGETFWPLHLLSVSLGLAVLVLALRGRGRIACALLALVWAWVGVTFLMQRYAELNWAGGFFGWGFLVQAAILLLVAALGLGLRRPVPSWHVPDWMAMVLACFGLLGYPLVAVLSAQASFQAETFGIHPDPTAVVTLGVVVFILRGPLLWLVLSIPLVWSLITGLTLQALDIAWASIPLLAIVIALIGASWQTISGMKQTGRSA